MAYLLDALIVFAALMLVIAALVGVSIAIGGETVAIALLLVAVFIGPAVYYVYFVGNERGQTYGRRAVGIQVREGDGYGALGYGRALGRYVIVFVFGIFTFPLVIDYLWPLWDRRNQTLHDKMVGSVVVGLRPRGGGGECKELAVRHGWSAGRAGLVLGGSVIGALIVGRVALLANEAAGEEFIGGAVFACGAIGGAALGAAAGFGWFGRALALRGVAAVLGGAALGAVALGGLSVLGNHEETDSGEEPFSLEFSDQWMFAAGAMFGAALGASVGCLAFLIWALRKVRKARPATA